MARSAWKLWIIFGGQHYHLDFWPVWLIAGPLYCECGGASRRCASKRAMVPRRAGASYHAPCNSRFLLHRMSKPGCWWLYSRDDPFPSLYWNILSLFCLCWIQGVTRDLLCHICGWKILEYRIYVSLQYSSGKLDMHNPCKRDALTSLWANKPWREATEKSISVSKCPLVNKKPSVPSGKQHVRAPSEKHLYFVHKMYMMQCSVSACDGTGGWNGFTAFPENICHVNTKSWYWTSIVWRTMNATKTIFS